MTLVERRSSRWQVLKLLQFLQSGVGDSGGAEVQPLQVAKFLEVLQARIGNPEATEFHADDGACPIAFRQQ